MSAPNVLEGMCAQGHEDPRASARRRRFDLLGTSWRTVGVCVARPLGPKALWGERRANPPRPHESTTFPPAQIPQHSHPCLSRLRGVFLLCPWGMGSGVPCCVCCCGGSVNENKCFSKNATTICRRQRQARPSTHTPPTPTRTHPHIPNTQHRPSPLPPTAACSPPATRLASPHLAHSLPRPPDLLRLLRPSPPPL